MSQMPSAQIALAPVIEACKRRQLLSRNAVSSLIFPIGDRFSIGNESWKGLAILTSDAVFLLRCEKEDAVAGAPASPSADPTAICRPPMLSVFYSDLPGILTEDASWPTPPSTTCAVSVLMRDKTRLVRLVPFSTDVEFESEHPLLRVSCVSVGAVATADHLARAGWVKTAPVVSAAASHPYRKWAPLAIAAALVAFTLLTVLVIQVDAINTQLALLICIPLLALAAWGMMHYLAPPVAPNDASANDLPR